MLRTLESCRAATAFDRYLPRFAEDGTPGYGVPAAKTQLARPARVDSTLDTVVDADRGRERVVFIGGFDVPRDGTQFGCSGP